jgi:hypothetical protein
MAAALAPVPLWLAAISALPHKEERFLYVIYPLVRAPRPRGARAPAPCLRPSQRGCAGRARLGAAMTWAAALAVAPSLGAGCRAA